MSATASHGEVASRLVARLPAGVFAHAARDGVLHRDFTALEQMLPGVRFEVLKPAADRWELTGVCADGSVVTWGVGA
jgi:hypothetical protein